MDENSPQYQARKNYFDRLYHRLMANPVDITAIDDLFKVTYGEVRDLLEWFGVPREDSYDEAGATIENILLLIVQRQDRIAEKGFLRWFEDEVRGANVRWAKREQAFALLEGVKGGFRHREWLFLQFSKRFLPRWPAPVHMQRMLASAGHQLTFTEVVQLEFDARQQAAGALGGEWPY